MPPAGLIPGTARPTGQRYLATEAPALYKHQKQMAGPEDVKYHSKFSMKF